MSVYKTKVFARFARKAELDDEVLLGAAAEVVAGRYEADLGGGVFKKRVARPGAGKSGGFRTLLAFRHGSDCFFVVGFAKNEKANLSPKDLAAVHDYAAMVFAYDAKALSAAVAAGGLIELEGDGEGSEKVGI
ncbi:MAG: type II toxin-antitoxin system RelE/ParE family toxin [Phenylobacterium sp.]|uniref:type II toxin-antitoxin system RelE/ParE family toxin n=1 Tax=Phenylobacterium sp. TaxID=1871053 RepID=UPI0012014BDD|nr:type II toxin-antitoxin system RelE/ParE family toxin [Phenylobacterium sp.]TAJ71711.1 MAG: type II toxin-antitoxin system RelE/ParE family toxin [Phenylobacterium sp.]